MRVVALEEHIAFPEMTQYLPPSIKDKVRSNALPEIQSKLEDISEERLRSIRTAGISMQVLSVENTDISWLPDHLSPAFAMSYNDLVAEKNQSSP